MNKIYHEGNGVICFDFNGDIIKIHTICETPSNLKEFKMDIKEALEQLHASKKFISDYFNVKIYDLEDMTDTNNFWKQDGGSIHYGPAEDEIEMYSLDIICGGIYIKDDYSLFYVDNGCGDKFYALFNNLNEMG